MPLSRIDPSRYEDQLGVKIGAFQQRFAAFSAPSPSIFRSQALSYRQRAEFRIWHHEGRIDYAMFGPDDPKQPVAVPDFPIAAEPIRALMPKLRDWIQGNDVLRRKLFQVAFLATLSGELLVTLIYHRPLDEDWEAAARELAAGLDVRLIGRSRKQKIVLDRDWLLEAFELEGRHLQFQQIEGSFTQPNAGVNLHMLAWARARAAGLGGDLLELYCGNGNFTVALAPLFERVLATEVSRSSVKSAQYNLAANGVDNVAVARLSSDEISAALLRNAGTTPSGGLDLESYRFSTLFVDPPRCGLDAATLRLAASFDHVLYISCNPQTLQENVMALNATHEIVATAVFDQFPYTDHLECGMLLSRRVGDSASPPEAGDA